MNFTGLYIATPHTRDFSGMFVDSLMQSHKPPPTVWGRVPNQPIDKARNELVNAFLKATDFSHLLMVDSDATWHPEAITRLIEADKDVVCGCMYTRAIPPVPTMGFRVGTRKSGAVVYTFGRSADKILDLAEEHGIDAKTMDAVLLPQTDHDLMEIDGCGSHFTLIKREVMEAVQYPWYVLDEDDAAGEDFYFCNKVKEAGFEIWCDFSVHTGHLIGPEAEIGLREFLAWFKYAAQLSDELKVDDLEIKWD